MSLPFPCGASAKVFRASAGCRAGARSWGLRDEQNVQDKRDSHIGEQHVPRRGARAKGDRLREGAGRARP